MTLRITGLSTLPEIRPGDRLAPLIREAAVREGHSAGEDTIIVVAQKIVSKAEGAIVDLRTVEPSEMARNWADQWKRDARLIELVLRESRRIVRMEGGLIIAETHHGLVSANAGVDCSNVPGDHFATVLPKDPDRSARCLQLDLGCGAVIISDTFGRPWREGLLNLAIGIAGMEAIEDLRGSRDRSGKALHTTVLARADELAAAAGLVMPKAGGVPVALIDGHEWRRGEGSMRALLRDPEKDLFR